MKEFKIADPPAPPATLSQLRELGRRVEMAAERLAKGSPVPVLDFHACTDGGECVLYSLPCVHGREVEAQPGLRVQLVEQVEGRTLLLCRAVEPLTMPRHYHAELEEVVVIDGLMRDLEDGEEYSRLRPARFPRRVWHQPQFVVPTDYLVIFRPQLPLREVDTPE